jgi:hypothetical protein
VPPACVTAFAAAEVRDAADLAGLRRILLEHEHVARAGRLQLDEAVFPEHLDGSEDPRVEPRRARHVAHGDGDVRQTVRLDHLPLYITRQTRPFMSSVM